MYLGLFNIVFQKRKRQTARNMHSAPLTSRLYAVDISIDYSIYIHKLTHTHTLHIHTHSLSLTCTHGDILHDHICSGASNSIAIGRFDIKTTFM